MSSTTDFLDTMDSVIREFGWIQGRLGSDEEGYCLLGSAHVALYKTQWAHSGEPHKTYEAAYAFIQAAIKDRCGPYYIPTYNDCVAKSAEDIHLILKDARTKAEAAE